jgi:hypothetical protein
LNIPPSSWKNQELLLFYDTALFGMIGFLLGKLGARGVDFQGGFVFKQRGEAAVEKPILCLGVVFEEGVPIGC